MKKLIITAIIGTIGVGGGVTTAVVVNSPEYVMSEAISNAVEDILERDDLSYVMDVLNNGSVQFNCNEDNNESFGGKVYFGLEDSKLYVENLNGAIKDENFSVSTNIYLSNDMMYIENEKYLDGAYGIKFKNLSEQFKDSIFYDDSEYELSLKYKDMIEDMLEYYETDYKDLQKDWKKLYKDYAKQLGKYIKEYGEFDADTKSVSLTDGRSKKRVVTLTLDEDALASIIEELADYISKDDKLEEFIETHVGNLNVLLSGELDKSLDADDIYDQLVDTLDELADEADELRDEDFEFKLSVVTPKASTKLLKIEVETENEFYGEKEESSFTIDFGSKGVKKSENIEILRNDEKVCSYVIKENSKDKFEISFTKYSTYYGETEEEMHVEFEVNKDKEKFNISLMEDELEVLLINGTLEINGKAITFKPTECIEKSKDRYYDSYLGKWVEEINEYDYLETVNLEITISTKDKMPKPNKDFKNVLEMTETTLDKIIAKLEEDNFI